VFLFDMIALGGACFQQGLAEILSSHTLQKVGILFIWHSSVTLFLYKCTNLVVSCDSWLTDYFCCRIMYDDDQWRINRSWG